MQPKDVRECVEIVASHPVVGPRYGAAIADLPKAWLRLLTSDAMLTGVFEETERGRIRPWCIGVSVIVTDDFLAELKKPPLSWIGPELARRLARDESPLLSARQLREANMAGGLNAVVWEGCIRAGYEDRPDLFHHIMGGFLDSHRGYLWKEIVASNAESVDRLERTLYSGGRLWDPAAPGHDPARRGKEKRRRLLAYLRDHPEELRPLSRKAIATRGFTPSRFLHAALATIEQETGAVR